MLIRFGSVPFDADLVAFDKDGTLIDFEFMWGRMATAWVEHLVEGGQSESLQRDLYRSLGFDPDRQRTEPESPLAIATTAQLQTIAAATLYRHGVPWPEAEDRARLAFDTGSDLPLSSLIRATGDVAGLLGHLRESGVRVAVITTDDRAATVETLRILGIAHLVELLVCGDDGLPSKPAPDMLLAVFGRSGVEPACTVVVGDTLGDLLMAQRAGAGLRVAVLTGPGDPAKLAQQADVVLKSIDEIRVGL